MAVLLGTFCQKKISPGQAPCHLPLPRVYRGLRLHAAGSRIRGGLIQERRSERVDSAQHPDHSPPAHSPRTDDGQVGTGSDAGDHVGGDALPLPVVLLTQGSKLETPAGQGIVLASAGLPYLGQTRGQRGRQERGGRGGTRSTGKKRSHQHVRSPRTGREQNPHTRPAPPPPLLQRTHHSRSQPRYSAPGPVRTEPL